MSKPAFLNEEYAEAAVKRWGPLLEGINSDYQRSAVAALLDNQAQFNENATRMGAVEPFTRFSFPLIRRIYPDMIANRLVSVQPMSMPTGMIFYMDFEYASDVAPVKVGDRNDYQSGNIPQARHYSHGRARGAVIGTTTNAASADSGEKTFQLPVPSTARYPESDWVPVVPGSVKFYFDSTDSGLTVIHSGTPGANEVLVDPRTGAVTFGTTPGFDGSDTVSTAVTADFDLKIIGDDSRIPELRMQMTSDNIAATVRKLKVRWELEAEQDLRAYHGLSMERELVSHAADEIRREIDREIISDLVDAGNTNTTTWFANYDARDATSSGGTGPAGGSYGYTKAEWNETIWEAILQAERGIYERRLVKANFIVTGPDVATRLEALNGFRFMGDFTGGSVVEGPHLFGNLRNRFEVYVDPLFPDNKILLGYKGAEFFRTGYVYAPYVPLIITDQFMDPDDFTPRRGLMRRDAKKLLSSDFYAVVNVDTGYAGKLTLPKIS